MSEATLEENLKSRRRHSSGWEVRLSEDLPTPTNLAALKREKKRLPLSLAQHPRQVAFPCLQQAFCILQRLCKATAAAGTPTASRWGANQCFPPSPTNADVPS